MEKQFFMVYAEDQGAPTYKHENEQAASKEAERLAEKLGVSPSRISEYLTGKSEPTLKIARTIHRELNIDADLILGIC